MPHTTVRVMAESDRLREAWALCCGLLRYIWEPDTSWPYIIGSTPKGTPRQVLRRQERLFVSDQVLAELVQLVIASDAEASQRVGDLSPISSAARESPMVSQVVSLCEGLNESGPDEDFLIRLCEVIEGGRVELPQTWAKLDRFAEQLIDSYSKVAARFTIRT